MTPRVAVLRGRVVPVSGETGASLVFALVAVSITSLVVVSLTNATTAGFLAARGVDATKVSTSGNGALTTKAALVTAMEAVRVNPDTGYRSFWSADARSVSAARCFGATDATSGANFLDVTSADGDTVRVYCTPTGLPGAASAANPFNQQAAQPDLSDGLVLLHRSTAPALSVTGPGTLFIQGRVRSNGAVSFASRSVTCPQATSSTTFVNSVDCPQLEVAEVVPGDGTGSVTATACDPTAIAAAGSVTCNPGQTATTPSVPHEAPTAFGTGTVANGPLDIRCTGARATMSPGLYSETATTGITATLNALTGSSPTSCVAQSTTLKATANVGATSLSVNERKGFRAGDLITVGGAGGETLTIKSTYAAATGAGSLSLASAATRKWTSGNTVTGRTCVLGSGSPCNGSGGVTITSLQLTPGVYFFDLSANWTVDNPGVTVIGGTEYGDGSASIGNLCVAPTDQSSPAGVVLAFDGGTTTGGNNASGYGMVVNRGTVSLCADPPADTSDRPVVLYGSTSALSGSYRKVGATTNTPYTFAARGSACAIGTKTNCSIVSVTAQGHLYLYGGVYAPYDDVSLVTGPYDDDQLLLYGIVADALSVTTSQVTLDAPSRVRPVCGIPRMASNSLDVEFSVFRCDGTCPTAPPGTGQVGAAVASFVPATVSGVDTRTATLTGPLASAPFWSVTG